MSLNSEEKINVSSFCRYQHAVFRTAAIMFVPGKTTDPINNLIYFAVAWSIREQALSCQ